MAPGPPNLTTNRFATLDEVPSKKRKNAKQSYQAFPSLPTVKKPNHKFVVISSTDNNKPISKFSCFAVHRALKLISKDIISISELRDGNLLLLTNGSLAAEKFIAAKELFGICPIKASYHKNLNFTKGTVFAPFLNHTSEEEIVKEMSDQGVVEAYKFSKKVEGKSMPTGVVLLTFDLYHLPDKVDISWRSVLVREYTPNPMRCKKCQLLGHLMKYCTRPATCVNCNLPPHESQPCSRTFCANCSGDHPASNNTCPRFIQAKEIMKIKTQKKCSMREATHFHQQQQTNQTSSSFTVSFASIAKNSLSNQQMSNSKPNNNSENTIVTNDKTSVDNPSNTNNNTNENVTNIPKTKFDNSIVPVTTTKSHSHNLKVNIPSSDMDVSPEPTVNLNYTDPSSSSLSSSQDNSTIDFDIFD